MRIVLRFALTGLLAATPAVPLVGASAEPVKAPTKAELGAMLAKCSAEADVKGLTVPNGKGEARKAYRRACMLKNGVAPKAK